MVAEQGHKQTETARNLGGKRQLLGQCAYGKLISRAILGGGGVDQIVGAVAIGSNKILVAGTGFGYSLSRDWQDIRL